MRTKDGGQLCRVTVVIVNWNRCEYVKDLLDSLSSIDYCHLTTVVVDNASTDGSVEVIENHPIDAVLVRNKVNVGGSGGFADGVACALEMFQQDYIWLLDNDVKIKNDTLFHLIEAMKAKRNAGIIGSKIMLPEVEGIVMERGGYIDWNFFTWLPCYNELRGRELLEEEILEVEYVAACSMLVKREVFEAVGVFDRDFFLHWDDIEFCMRARLHGYKVFCADKSVIYHSVSREFRPSLLYYDIRNGLFTFERLIRKEKNFLTLYKILNKILKIGVYFLFQKKPRYALIIKDALLDYYSNKGGGYGHLERYSEFLDCAKTSWETIGNNSYVAVFADPIFGKGKEIINALRRRGFTRYDLIMDVGLAPVMEGKRDENVYFYDFRRSNSIAAVKFLFFLLSKRYDLCICEPDAINPLNFFFKQVYLYSPEHDNLYLSKISLRKAHLPFLTVILACLLSCVFYPFTLFKALFAKKQLTKTAVGTILS